MCISFQIEFLLFGYQKRHPGWKGVLYQAYDRYSGVKRGKCEKLVENGVKSEYSCTVLLLALLAWPGDLIHQVTKGTIITRVWQEMRFWVLFTTSLTKSYNILIFNKQTRAYEPIWIWLVKNTGLIKYWILQINLLKVGIVKKNYVRNNIKK